MNFEQINSKKVESRFSNLADCDLSVRACNTLRSLGIETLEKLCEYSEEELKSFTRDDEFKTPFISNKTIEEIKTLVSSHKLSLKDPA